MRGGHACAAHREGVCLPPHSIFILISTPPRGHVVRTEVVGLQPERRTLHNPSSASSTFPPGLLPQVWYQLWAYTMMMQQVLETEMKWKMSLPLGTLRLSIITLLGSRCKAQGRIRGHTAGCSEAVGQGRGGVQESYRVGELLGESGALNIAFCWIFFESPKALGRLSLQGIQAPPLSAPLQHFQPSFHLSIPSPPPSTAAWELLSPGAKLRLKDQP